MMLFRCVVKNGHAGSGRHTERSVYIRAKSAVDAMMKAKRIGRREKGAIDA